MGTSTGRGDLSGIRWKPSLVIGYEFAGVPAVCIRLLYRRRAQNHAIPTAMMRITIAAATPTMIAMWEVCLGGSGAGEADAAVADAAAAEPDALGDCFIPAGGV